MRFYRTLCLSIIMVTTENPNHQGQYHLQKSQPLSFYPSINRHPPAVISPTSPLSLAPPPLRSSRSCSIIAGVHRRRGRLTQGSSAFASVLVRLCLSYLFLSNVVSSRIFPFIHATSFLNSLASFLRPMPMPHYFDFVSLFLMNAYNRPSLPSQLIMSQAHVC